MPRITLAGDDWIASVPGTSMRPGRNAPDNPGAGRGAISGPRDFNEAGAKCPG